MTGVEMQRAFGIEINQFSDALIPDSVDIFYWLNKSQLEFIMNNLSGRNQDRAAFEQNQQLYDHFRPLVTKNHVIQAQYVSSGSAIEGFFVDRLALPEDYMYLISSRSAVKYNKNGIVFAIDQGKRVPADEFQNPQVFIHPNRVSQSDDIYQLLNDPFNKTSYASPLTDLHNKHIDIYTDDTFIVDSGLINYIRKPASIARGTTCELADYLHPKIVEGAVSLFLNNTRNLKERLQREAPVD